MSKLTPLIYQITIMISIASFTSVTIAVRSPAMGANRIQQSDRQPTKDLQAQFYPGSPVYGVPGQQYQENERQRRIQEEQRQRDQKVAREQATAARQQLEMKLERKGDYISLGNLRYEQNDFAGALSAFNQAIVTQPKNPKGYSNRGHLKYTQEDWTGALADFNKAISLDPKFSLAYTNRGNVKDVLKDFAGALADHTQAITLDPQFALAYSNRGIVKFHQQNRAGAIEDFRQAVVLYREQGKEQGLKDTMLKLRALGAIK
jgi:tetratricopeptide (TPR) repeat protein